MLGRVKRVVGDRRVKRKEWLGCCGILYGKDVELSSIKLSGRGACKFLNDIQFHYRITDSICIILLNVYGPEFYMKKVKYSEKKKKRVGFTTPKRIIYLALDMTFSAIAFQKN